MPVSRRKYNALVAAYVQVLEQRDTARREARAALAATHLAAGQFSSTDDALGRARLNRLRDAVTYRRRIARLVRAVATYRAALTTQTRHADRLQAAYDGAVGLDHPDVDAGAQWQERRTDRPRLASGESK